jgi:phosphatidylinositol alpha-1,6-mannosyltransferase
MPPVTIVPPGVDVERFRPLSAEQRAGARARWGLPVEGRLVLSVSRLVPRKGMDVLIRAGAVLAPRFPDLALAIGGHGRDLPRLQRLVGSSGAPVRLLGRVDDAELPDLYGCADVFAMLCRNRWLGLEQEGFGIVFLEAAAAGVAQLAGRSGGAGEAVDEGRTGRVVAHPRSVAEAEAVLSTLLADGDARRRMGREARRRAVEVFSYDALAPQLSRALAAVGG